MSKSEREELLRNAMVFISRRELARRLRVSPSALDEWISGKAPISDGAMFVLVAVLNEIARHKRSTDTVKDGSSFISPANQRLSEASESRNE